MTPLFATWSIGGDLLVSREIGRQSIFGQLSWYRITGDAAFEFTGTRRDDNLIDASAGILLRSLTFKQLAPVNRLRWTHNRSPVFFLGYSRLRAELSLTSEF